jgi:hypothetical protein
VLEVITSTRGVPSDYFYLFDKVAYFLIKHKDDILVGSWTEICHQLMRKCPFSRNEDLMLHYKNKVKQNLSSLSGAHIPKMAFILSRSQFPFEEIILRDVLHDGIIRRSSNYEIGSLVPSLARSRFRNFEIIDKMCEDYVVSASKDVSKSFS